MNSGAIAAELRKAMRPRGLWIDGREVAAASGRAIPVVNPATGETLCEVAAADERDVNVAVRAARRAFEGGPWPRMSAAERGRILWRVGDLVQREAESLAVLESLHNGKTAREAMRGDLPPSWDIFHYYAGSATKIHGETIPVEGPYLNYTLREPVGVCGQIVPWNYPLLMAAWKIAPALACGNTVVLKPSEMTPLTALRLAELCAEAGVPSGVVNVVNGHGDQAGRALALHMDVDKVAFTGSTRTARDLLRCSADSNLKRLSLELGGKSPNAIFADADLGAALPAAFWGIYANKGEVCSAGSRLLVERSRYDEVVTRLADMARAMKVGDPLAPETQMGAQTGEAQMKKILGYVEKGRAEGARLVTGGRRLGDRGLFVEPTVFADVRPDMAIAQEEIFGPVLACMPFDDDDDAVRIANSTMYGLCAAVWTRDVGRAHALARRIRAGTVWINLYNGFDSASPFGGVRQSGWGREMGAHALELYTQVKSVWVRLAE